MNELLQKIDSLERDALSMLGSISSGDEVEALRIRLLGRKGELTAILKNLSTLSADEKPIIGSKINTLKTKLNELIDQRLLELKSKELEESVLKHKVDITVPARGSSLGHVHPLSKVNEEITNIFISLGFSVHEGPEIETEYFNFTALNFPPDHPAVDMHDTFYIEGKKLLRTHTSPVQIHVMKKMPPPVYMIAPGAVYRRDSDLSHSPMFHQIEGLMVDEKIRFSDLKGVLTSFCKQFFDPTLKVRFRPSFFPFTEPSAEMDIGCVICSGKGCGVCKYTGWVEVLGCGMVDPAVFKEVGYDPNRYQGFAFGFGVDRMTMLKYGINNIRLLYENDLRFLEQF